MEPLAAIQGYLSELRWRKRLLHLVRDGGIFTALAALCLLGAMLAASAISATGVVRLLSLLLLLPGCLGFGLYLTRALRRLGHPAYLARAVEQARPGLQGDLLSTVELSQQPAAALRCSRALVSALALDTWQRLDGTPPAALVPGRLLRPAAVLLAVATLGWALAVVAAPQRVRTGGSRLFSAGPALQVELSRTPITGDLSITYRFPAYMRRPPKEVDSTTGHVTAPRGTTIQIRTTPLLAFSRATLVLQEKQQAPRRVTLTPDRDGQVTGSFTVQQRGVYWFELESRAGRRMEDPVRRRVDMELDAFPRITLFGPRSGLEIRARSKVEVGFTADDDHGLSRVTLIYQVQDRKPQRVVKWGARPAPTRSAVSKSTWDLASLSLAPGNRIAYWMEARDNDTVSGPKVTRSATLYLKVFSPQEKHARALQLQNATLEHAVRLLGARLLLFGKEPVLSPALRLQNNRTVHVTSSRLVDMLRELRNHMRQDSLMPAAVRRSISRMHQRMRRLVRTESALLRERDSARLRGQVRAAHLRPLEEHNRKLVAELEQAVLALADLLDEQRLQGIAELVERIKELRGRLEKLLERYRDNPSEELKRQISQLIRQLEQRMQQLRSKVAKLESTIPDEYLNAAALRQVMPEKHLRRIKDLLRQGDLSKMEQALKALSRDLDQLQAMTGGNLKQFRKGRRSESEQRYSRLMDRLRGLEREQREIASNTERIIRSYRRRAARLMKHKIQPFIRSQLARLAEVKKKLGEIDTRVLNPYDQEQLQRARQRHKNLKDLLQQGDLDEALQISRRMRNILQVLEDDLSEEAAGHYSRRRKRLRKAHRRSRSARRTSEQIAADLEAIFPRPRSLLDRPERQKLRQLQRRQQNLRKQLQQTLRQLGKEPGKMPFMGNKARQSLKDSSEFMGKAAGTLRSLKVQQAHGFQEAAADKLSGAQKSMRASRRSSRKRGAGARRERIKIPGAESFRPPREFRQDILEAMKEKAPRGFLGQVKRYYEELVR